MSNLEIIGSDFLFNQIEQLTDSVERMSPVEYNEGHRYLPLSVSRFSGYIDFSLTPYWIEIIQNADVASPVREWAVKKGVQVAYTTGLESVAFYLAGHLRTVPSMFATTDKELANDRMEHNIIPMFQQSGMNHIFQSADIDNSHKTGKTKNHLQWEGGGFMIPRGAKNADKMRMFSIIFMLMDEIDAWSMTKTGDDPVKLFKDRCKAFWEIRKIMMGSTPELKGSSKIDKQYLRGDQRKYMCNCLKCGMPQALRWSGKNKETGKKYGFNWDYDDGCLDIETVRYECRNCGHAHFEYDKPKLFSQENAEWVPTSKPQVPHVRSYHLPAFYSAAGMQPWYSCVEAHLDAFDPITNVVKDFGALKVFYNNILGESYEETGGKVRFAMVSGHRRSFFIKGEIPNHDIVNYCTSTILFLTMAVDVHKDNLAVAVFGWTAQATCWLVEYMRIKDGTGSDSGCYDPESPVWGQVQEFIDEKEWKADDGKVYRLVMSFIDANGEAYPTVTDFCAQWESNVYPIIGRARPPRNNAVKEYDEFKTQSGYIGYKITVDHYKDRLVPILRRDWQPEMGDQKQYTFNAPLDTTDDEIKELTREYKRQKSWPDGTVTYEYHRPGNAPNELWDLLVYASASVEVLANLICIQYFEETEIDWFGFWKYIEENEIFFKSPEKAGQ